MSLTHAPGAETIRSARLDLVSLGPVEIDALLGGRADGTLAGLELPSGWPDGHDGGFLRLRADEMRGDPDAQPWLVRALVLRRPSRRLVGHAGFHGPPGTNGPRREDALELGYTVFPAYCGRGYAKEAAQALIGWARAGHGIEHFVASASPGNEPSLAIIRGLGFSQTGSQWDAEDGEELVFELRSGPI